MSVTPVYTYVSCGILLNQFLHRLLSRIYKTQSTSSFLDVFYKKVVPRNFAKFRGKHLCQSLFFSIFRSINSIIKQYCSCCIILIRTDTILSRNMQNNFQNLLLKKLLTQSGDQTYFGNFTCRQTHFGYPKLSGECQVTSLDDVRSCCFVTTKISYVY